MQGHNDLGVQGSNDLHQILGWRVPGGVEALLAPRKLEFATLIPETVGPNPKSIEPRLEASEVDCLLLGKCFAGRVNIVSAIRANVDQMLDIEEAEGEEVVAGV
jgi:hypothetical protein